MLKSSPMNSHINCPEFHHFRLLLCPPPLHNWSYIVFTEGRPHMKPVGFSHSCLPVCSLTHLYTCPTVPRLNVVFLWACQSILLHTGGCIQNSAYHNCIVCKSHAILYRSFNPPKFQSLHDSYYFNGYSNPNRYISEYVSHNWNIYYIHTYIPLLICKAVTILPTYIPIFLQHLTS